MSIDLRQINQHLNKTTIRLKFAEAIKSRRKRSLLVINKKFSYLNKSFNFILNESYMQPHCHPSSKKNEKIYLLKGKIMIIIFDTNGKKIDNIILKSKFDNFTVKAFTYHTYISLSKFSITYEEMNGVYNIKNWKKFPSWAPKENNNDRFNYLKFLKNDK